MDGHQLELTAAGRLLCRRNVETPEGLRPEVKDFTDDAHLFLNRPVAFGEGATLGSLLELLKANPTLLALQTTNFAAAYLARYEAIRRGEITPKAFPFEDGAPKIEALALSLKQELELPRALWDRLVQAQTAPTPSRTRLDREQAEEGGVSQVVSSDQHWDVFGLSYPFEADSTFSGVDYKAGQRVHYSLSFSFDQSIELPLRLLPGSLTLEVRGQKSKDYSITGLDIGTPDIPPSITLYECIESILFDISFHGAPEDAQSVGEDLKEQVLSLDKEAHAEDLSYSSSAVFCPEQFLGDLADELSDTELFWGRERALAHTGWASDELDERIRQGRLMELSAPATDTRPRRKAFPRAQFAPSFDAELFRYLNWVASYSCSDWAAHRFLKSWPNTKLSEASELAAPTVHAMAEGANGWDVLLCAEEQPHGHEAIADPALIGHARKVTPLRPVFAEGSAKRTLVEAFEAFAADRRRRYDEE
jgi:hypothetical protein